MVNYIQTRRPRTKISVTPCVTRKRSTPGGHACYDLLRPRAVFYLGWGDEKLEQDGFQSLESFVEGCRQRNPRQKTSGCSKFFVYMGVVIAGAVLWWLWDSHFQAVLQTTLRTILRTILRGLQSSAQLTSKWWDRLRKWVLSRPGIGADWWTLRIRKNLVLMLTLPVFGTIILALVLRYCGIN